MTTTANSKKDDNQQNSSKTINSLNEVIDALKTAYEKDLEKANVKISFDLKNHTLKPDKNNEIIVHLRINKQKYHATYKDFNAFEKDLDNLCSIENDFAYEDKHLTHQCIESKALELIKENFTDKENRWFNTGYEDILYHNFMVYFYKNIDKNFVLNDTNKQLFANKHLEVSIKTDILDDATKEQIVWLHKPVSSEKALKLISSLEGKDLVVSLSLSNNIVLVYKLNLFHKEVYSIKNKRILVDEITLITYYQNLIREFYDAINNTLSNKQLDFLFQIAKYNKWQYRRNVLDENLARYGITLNKNESKYLIIQKPILVNDEIYCRPLSTIQVAKNNVPICFYYNNQTKTFNDDGVSLIVYNDSKEIVYKHKKRFVVNNLKYAYKSLKDWSVWYESINKQNQAYKNFKDALNDYNEFKDENIINLNNIAFYNSYTDVNNLEVFFELDNSDLTKLKMDKNIVWLENDTKLLWVGFNYYNKAQIDGVYNNILKDLKEYKIKPEEKQTKIIK